MRETQFIDQNKDKWKELERTLDGRNPSPEKLNDLFVHITDDLSYSRTFYTNRSVRVYLNGLAQRIFLLIYKNRKSHRHRLVSFWTNELPQLVYESRSAFRLSLFAFLMAILIGMLSCAMDPAFAEIILGESYIDMTMKNIASGDPMAVYKEKGKFGMFLGITMNNLFVAFLTFVMGAFYMIGALAVLIRNGIMIGTFQYFFIERGLFWESFLTIWIHGTLEVSAIIIAGAAGITMGRGLIFPGTYTRLQSFQKSARRGLKIMIGISPIIILAGFFEGFLTRMTETPDLIKGLFILFCLIFVLGYFVWYPLYKAQKGFAGQEHTFELSSDQYGKIDYGRIKPSGEIFSEIFVLFAKFFKPIILTAALGSLLFCAIIFTFSPLPPSGLFSYYFDGFQSFKVLEQFFSPDNWTVTPVLTILLLSALTWKGLSLIEKNHRPDLVKARNVTFHDMVKATLGVTSLYCVLWLNSNIVLLG
ncbi:MAG: stage II sporulation protein M, partial [Bacteroidota bacterium]